MQNKKQLKILDDFYEKLENLEVDFEMPENWELFEEKKEYILITLQELRVIISTDESLKED